MNWDDILKHCSNPHLSFLCDSHGLDEFVGMVTPRNRARVIQKLGEVLGTRQAILDALVKAGPVEMAILRHLMERGGQAETITIGELVNQDMLKRPVEMADGKAARGKRQPRFDIAVLLVMRLGLVFSRDHAENEYDFGPGRHIFIPEPVADVIHTEPAWRKALVQPAPDVKASAVTAPDTMLSIESADFQRDLSRYLRHVRKEKEVALTTVGWIYKSNFKTFLAALNAPVDAPAEEATHGRLWFMRRLLSAMGELEQVANVIHPRLDGTLLTLPMAQRIQQAYETWSETGAWNELNRIQTEHQGYDYRRDAPPELSKARAAVLRAVARLSATLPDAWLSTAALIDSMRRSDYQFLFPRKYNYREMFGNTSLFGTPYYANNNPFNMSFPGVKDERSGWENVERQVIASMLTGPLYWMGLVSLGFNKGQPTVEGSEPTAFRLTPSGAWLLGLAGQPVFIESGGRVLVQPNFTIIAMEPVSDEVLLALDEFAVSQGGDRAVT
ncbi:MAG TPA: hypothetical protein VGK87_10770, partial [Anaerolineae bacterium]